MKIPKPIYDLDFPSEPGYYLMKDEDGDEQIIEADKLGDEINIYFIGRELWITKWGIEQDYGRAKCCRLEWEK